MDFFTMLTHFIILMSRVSLGAGEHDLPLCPIARTEMRSTLPFVSALYRHSSSSELLAVRDITPPATLEDDLSSYLGD